MSPRRRLKQIARERRVVKYAMIQEAYRVAGVPDPPAWRSYDAPHEFNVQMQAVGFRRAC
jgi:hypothetical protein